MGCTNSIMSRLWTGWLRNLGSIPGRGRRFLFYIVSGLAFVPTLPPNECVRCSSLEVKCQSSEADSPQLHIAKAECIKLYPLLLHRPWCCAQGWPHFILYSPKNLFYLMCKIPDTESSWYIVSFSEPWRAMWVTCTNVVSSHLDWWCCLAVQICNWKSGQLKPDNVLLHSVAIQQL